MRLAVKAYGATPLAIGSREVRTAPGDAHRRIVTYKMRTSANLAFEHGMLLFGDPCQYYNGSIGPSTHLLASRVILL